MLWGFKLAEGSSLKPFFLLRLNTMWGFSLIRCLVCSRCIATWNVFASISSPNLFVLFLLWVTTTNLTKSFTQQLCYSLSVTLFQSFSAMVFRLLDFNSASLNFWGCRQTEHSQIFSWNSMNGLQSILYGVLVCVSLNCHDYSLCRPHFCWHSVCGETW